jgi:hypothetical protein
VTVRTIEGVCLLSPIWRQRWTLRANDGSPNHGIVPIFIPPPSSHLLQVVDRSLFRLINKRIVTLSKTAKYNVQSEGVVIPQIGEEVGRVNLAESKGELEERFSSRCVLLLCRLWVSKLRVASVNNSVGIGPLEMKPIRIREECRWQLRMRVFCVPQDRDQFCTASVWGCDVKRSVGSGAVCRGVYQALTHLSAVFTEILKCEC